MEDSGFKVSISKLTGQDDWAKWKWTMGHVLKAHQLEGVVKGVEKKPTGGEGAVAADAVTKWTIKDAKAVSLIATALGDQISKLVLTCETSNEIWTLLSARFERSSKQRLDSIVEQFYRLQKDESEDIITHIATLQKIFMDMNIELKNHQQNELSEIMLTLRIMSTLGKEYNSFRDVWDSLPSEKQTLTSLIERLCNIEKREAKSNEQAFMARKQERPKEGSDKKKKKKDSKEDKKKRFPCRKCNELGHWAAECPSKEEERSKSAFMAKALSATRFHPEITQWICDSVWRHFSTRRRRLVTL